MGIYHSSEVVHQGAAGTCAILSTVHSQRTDQRTVRIHFATHLNIVGSHRDIVIDPATLLGTRRRRYRQQTATQAETTTVARMRCKCQ